MQMKVALVAIVKDENHLVEWCRYHMSLGFDKIFLYCNDWMPSYALPNSVNVIPIAGQRKQMIAYQQWTKAYGHSYDYAMFLDADEYLYLVKWNTVQEMLIQIVQGKRSMVINWVFFGSKEEPFMFHTVVSRYLHRDDSVDRHVKTIMKLGVGNYMINPHHGHGSAISPEHKEVIGSYNEKGSMENAFIAHYYYQSPDHWDKKVKRGRADSNLTRVGEPYKEFDYDKVYDTRITTLYSKLFSNPSLLERINTTLNPGSDQRTVN